MYKLAYKLHDLKLGKSFEDCLKAVKQALGDEAEAVKVLQSKQQWKLHSMKCVRN